jgi:hypothetical protein
MRLLPWDPDVETVISRIKAGVLDLQPEFQRGEVWPRSKKQRLIDSILRDWHVPPLHVVENPDKNTQEVLDGQQRLVAIRDFVEGNFAVDGGIEPLDPTIQRLDGKRYRTLPEDVRRKFDRFSLRVYRIVDFKSTEPAELFFRLNQPTNLTGAEQRNAFFGPVRRQIKELVDELPLLGLDKSTLGFSNARMSYDDVLSRVALTLKRGTLAMKIGSTELVELYRSEEPVADNNLKRLRDALKRLGESTKHSVKHLRFNKATLYTWLIFLVRASHDVPSAMECGVLSRFLGFFAEGLQHKESLSPDQHWLLTIYEDRSTARVSDISSVVARDVALWLIFLAFLNAQKVQVQNPLLENLRVSTARQSDAEEIARVAIVLRWTDLA